MYILCRRYAPRPSAPGSTTATGPLGRTSILSMSTFPYCFLSSLFAVCIASTVAIVFRRFSVASAALSMLNVCCVSCASCASYIRFCFSVRSARSWIAFYFFARARQPATGCMGRSARAERTLPGPGRSLLIWSLYRASSPSSFLIFTSIEPTRASV